MSDVFEGQKCEHCGKPAKRYMFAAFVCESEDCIEKAREARGCPSALLGKVRNAE